MLGFEFIAFGIVSNSIIYKIDGCPDKLAIIKSCDDALEKISSVKNKYLEMLEEDKTE